MLNHFQLFAMEEQFTLDLNALSQVYQNLQKTVHPDNFAHASEQEQLLSVQKSAQINDAYQVLKDPLKRAEYLLTLRGVDMPNEQHTFGDTAFLMRQMELREMLEEVQQASDIESALETAQKELAQEYKLHFNQMEQQILANDNNSNSLACNNLRKLKFYQKLNLEVDRLEEQLLD
jgi:molecular chaperone HscB